MAGSESEREPEPEPEYHDDHADDHGFSCRLMMMIHIYHHENDMM